MLRKKHSKVYSLRIYVAIENIETNLTLRQSHWLKGFFFPRCVQTLIHQDPAEAVRSALCARALFKERGNIIGELEVPLLNAALRGIVGHERRPIDTMTMTL